jgi:hypothetical protein
MDELDSAAGGNVSSTLRRREIYDTNIPGRFALRLREKPLIPAEFSTIAPQSARLQKSMPAEERSFRDNASRTRNEYQVQLRL